MDLNNISDGGASLRQEFDMMSPREKQELQQFLVAETQKAQIQVTIHSLTAMCFKKCITSKISAPALDKYEEPCMRQCVDRFMDTQNAVLSALQKLQSQR